jgi:hypothetical protein
VKIRTSVNRARSTFIVRSSGKRGGKAEHMCRR